MPKRLKGFIVLFVMISLMSLCAAATETETIDSIPNVKDNRIEFSISFGDILNFIGIVTVFFFTNKKIKQETTKQKQLDNIKMLNEITEQTYDCFKKSKLGLAYSMHKEKQEDAMSLFEEVAQLWESIEKSMINHGDDDSNKLVNCYCKKLQEFYVAEREEKTTASVISAEWQVAYFALLHSAAKREATGILTSPSYIISNDLENYSNATYISLLEEINAIINESGISKSYKIKKSQLRKITRKKNIEQGQILR